MELPDAVQLVMVGGQPLRVTLRRPPGAGLRANHERTGLVEGEDPVREVAAHVLEPGELGIAVRVVGLLPRLGPLEGDLVLQQNLPQPFAPDLDQTTSL